MSTVLAFDTSGPYVGASLMHNDATTTRVEAMKRGQAERLIPLLEEMLADQNLSWADLSALGVGIGPGNFTGIRIAVSAARGLAMGLNIPAVGVSAFETTQRLASWAQTAVPGPQGRYYLFDPDKMSEPIMSASLPQVAYALSDEHDTQAHLSMIATVAAEKAHLKLPPPKPLYIKPADAAPPKDAPPVLID